MTRKILYITGTRAEYGLMRSVLKEIQDDPDLSLDILVTGMHLMDEFGMTIQDIQKDGHSFHSIDAKYDSSKESVITFLSHFLLLGKDTIRAIDPDIILVAGDRAEMLAGAIIGAYLSVPVAHISGGDVTSTIDEHVRHAITKLANIHFPFTRKSANRIFRMGEDRWRIHISGAPQLDEILNVPPIAPDIISKKFHLDLRSPIVILIQHPVTLEAADAGWHIRETLEAIVELKYQTIVIYPNADYGGREMITIIRRYKKYPFIRTFKSIPREEYLSLLNISSVLVGNSSSGIIESPSFRIPVVNIGSRQEGRERADNVIDVGYDRVAIKAAVFRAVNDKVFRTHVARVRNPYGDGTASRKIIRILKEISLDRNLLQKKLRY